MTVAKQFEVETSSSLRLMCRTEFELEISPSLHLKSAKSTWNEFDVETWLFTEVEELNDVSSAVLPCARHVLVF